MVVLRYPVPERTRVSEDYPEDLSPRRVKIVVEYAGRTRTIVDKRFEPGTLLEYPLRIFGRAIAKIYVDDMEWPIETMKL